MNKILYLLVITFLLAGCAVNLVTGRKQLNLVSESEMQMMAVDQYRAFLSAHKVLNLGNNSSDAMAGYDPREAIPFWERMSAAGGGSPPEFLSTHPSDNSRMRKLKQFMPEALTYYKP